MEILIAIVAFVLFSVVSDAIEGMKKKRQNQELPQRQPQPQPRPPDKTRVEPEKKGAKRPDFSIPPLKGAPTPKKPVQTKPVLQSQYAAALLQTKQLKQAKQAEYDSIGQPRVTEKQPLQQADIHSDVLLSAIAYAQILQPPKAYQYMATRSCRGDWNNGR